MDKVVFRFIQPIQIIVVNLECDVGQDPARLDGREVDALDGELLVFCYIPACLAVLESSLLIK